MPLLDLFVIWTACIGLVHAQDGITLYQLPGCRRDSANHLRTTLSYPSPGGGDQCTRGTTQLPGWPTTSSGDYIVYYDGIGISSDCQVAIIGRNDRNPDFCGNAVAIIDGGSSACIEGILPPDYNIAHCCGDQNCQPIFPPNARQSSALETSPREVTEVKRSSLLRGLESRQDDCRWEGGAPFDSFGVQEVISNRIDCPGTMDCPITREWSVTVGSSNSFGTSASVTVGDIFQIVQASVSFSYEYTFEESRTEAVTETVNVPVGQSGVATFTPYTECTTGSWAGNCGGLETQGQGQVCVPVMTLPMGDFGFLQT